MTDLWAADAVTLAGMLRSREVSAREVVAAHIDRAQTVGGPVNAIVTPTFEAALAQAAAGRCGRRSASRGGRRATTAARHRKGQ